MKVMLLSALLLAACTPSAHVLPKTGAELKVGDTAEDVAAKLQAEGAERVQLTPDLDDYQYIKRDAVKLTIEEMGHYDQLDLNYPTKEPTYCALKIGDGIVQGVVFDTAAPKNSCPTPIRAGDSFGEVIAVVTAQLRTGELESVTLSKDPRLLGKEVGAAESAQFPTWQFRSRVDDEPVNVKLTIVDGKVESIVLLPVK